MGLIINLWMITLRGDYMEFEYAIRLALGIVALEDIPVMFRDKANQLQGTDELLDYVRNKQWEEIKVARDNAETSGLPFKNKVLDYDMRSAFKLDIAMETAKQVGENFSIDWTMQDNTVMTLTYADLLSIPLIAANYSNELHKKARAYRDKIYNETDIKTITKIKWE